MSRTTVDIDDPVLAEVKRRGKREGRSLGKVISNLLAEALSRRERDRKGVEFRWSSRAMEAQVDILDKDALWSALDAPGGGGEAR
jgi:hypothetical protein